MIGFKQNGELFYIKNEYADKNKFINAVTLDDEIPLYEDIKGQLPKPLWENHESVISCYNYTWKTAFRNIVKTDKTKGFAADYIDASFNGCTYMWDSSFMLMFTKYAEKIFPFHKTLDNFYAKQHKDGFICKEIDRYTGYDRYTRFDLCGTGPNILPLSEWINYLNNNDLDRLNLIFDPLMAYQKWLKLNRTWKDGSYFTGGIGSGMDNTVRLEKGYSQEFSHGHMSWIDMTLQQILNLRILEEMAKLIGREEEIMPLREERLSLTEFVNQKMWDNNTAFYYDLWKDGRLNMVKHIGAYWALLAGVVPQENIEPFIRHLENENEFKRPHLIPSVSYDDKSYCANGDYWRGGVWAPTNYMVLLGLSKYGLHELAHKIGLNTLQNVVKCYEETGTVWEFYMPEEVGPGTYTSAGEDFSRRDFVGWTGLIPISILFEYVFGIKADVKAKTITWNVNLLEKHGIENYPLGKDGCVDLICEARSSIDEEPVIMVRSNLDLTLKLYYNGKEKIIKINKNQI